MYEDIKSNLFSIIERLNLLQRRDELSNGEKRVILVATYELEKLLHSLIFRDREM
jgi:hypothetical protein